MSAATVADPLREKSLQDYRKKLLEHKEIESRLKESKLKRFVEVMLCPKKQKKTAISSS